MKHILKCQSCGKFTMKEQCDCGTKAVPIKPQKYSPGKFAEYRRKAKSEGLKRKGLL